jgi:hypothetical protein
MGVTVRNAVVQNGQNTVASAHFVAAQGLSKADKVAAFAALVEHAAQCLDLPHKGPAAAEILYQIADDRAGAAEIKFTPRPEGEVSGVSKPFDPKSLLKRRVAQGVLFALAAFAAGAFVAEMAPGLIGR